jgi:hypothetical protein
MAAKLKPLRDKNLQMEYRLSLQHNLYTVWSAGYLIHFAFLASLTISTK